MVRIDSVSISMDMHGKKTVTISRTEIPDFSDRTTVARLAQAIVAKEGGNVTGVHLHTMGKPIVPRRDGREMTMADYNIATNSILLAQLRLLGGAADPATTENLQLVNEGRSLNRRRVDDLPGITAVAQTCDYGCSADCGNAKMLRSKIDCGGFTLCADCMTKYLTNQLDAARTIPQLPDTGSTDCQPGSNCVHSRITNDDSGNVVMRYVAAMANLTPEEERQVVSRFFSNNQTVKVCPNRSCGMFVFTDGQQYRVRCPECRSHEWCFVCSLPWRNGSSQTTCGNDMCMDRVLTMWNQMLLNTQYETVNGVARVPTTRKCPNPQCFSLPMVRERNCKHITCAVCTESFCLSCLRRKSVRGECPFAPKCTPHRIQNITSVGPDGWTQA